jgi:hypothetical protein
MISAYLALNFFSSFANIISVSSLVIYMENSAAIFSKLYTEYCSLSADLAKKMIITP